MLAVDFRGYGWSTGQPRLTTLCADADALVDALPAILAQAGGDAAATRCALVGRSIGGVCAVHLASRHPTRFPSLLIESSLCRIFELPMVANIAAMMGPQGAVLLQALPDPFDQLGKLRAAPTVRCTVLHGDRDELIPLAQGKALFGASAAPPSRKRLVILKGAGHNDMVHDVPRARRRLPRCPPPTPMPTATRSMAAGRSRSCGRLTRLGSTAAAV